MAQRSTSTHPRAAMQDFATLLMADAALAAHLAAIEDGAGFIAEVMRSAEERGIALSEIDQGAAAQPDVLGLARWSPSAFAGPSLPPRDWLPVAVAAEPGTAFVDWAWFGAAPLRAPFYEHEICRALRRPFNRAFRYRTGLPDLIAQAETPDTLAPDGFIFHMSRCGSTLAAQMLAALDDSIVVSEAAPIDAVLRLGRGLPEDDAARALRAIVAAFGRKRTGREKRYFVKLDCWHTLALPLFRRAFPAVPWIFLYRDPAEVLVSQMRERGMQMVPQFLPPDLFGIAEADGTLDENYCARVLGAICRAVFDHRGLGGGLMLNYRALPEALWTAVLAHFGVSCSDAERDAMRRTATCNAKSPGMPFAADAQAKRQAATAKVRGAAARHLGEIYDRLESLSARRQLNVAT
jgi:hypothetical protein